MTLFGPLPPRSQTNPCGGGGGGGRGNGECHGDRVQHGRDARLRAHPHHRDILVDRFFDTLESCSSNAFLNVCAS